MTKTYKYVGPVQLGSVLAHVCAAAGLFVTKEEADLQLRCEEVGDEYVLCARLGDRCIRWTAPLSVEGRKTLGTTVLQWLRVSLGITEPSLWGTLVGMRPTKLVHKRYEAGDSWETIDKFLAETYDLPEDKRALLLSIAQLQRPYLDGLSDKDCLLYGGIPFCESHCLYCSFPYGLIQQQGQRLPSFMGAFVKDGEQLRSMVQSYGLRTTALYMGGGTPTALKDEDFDRALRIFASCASECREFTVEAGRPDSLSKAKLDAMVREGVTRISLNPQTMQDDILRRIGRGHTVSALLDAFTMVRKNYGFHINMDFIGGLPGQTVSMMKENMDYVVQLQPENVTIHTLALKKGSPLYEQDCPLPEGAAVQEMVALCHDRLVAAGYEPYYLYRQQYMRGQLENIGYTLQGKASLYNMGIMEEEQPLLSMGPGSSSKWMRGPAFRQIKQYIPKDVDSYVEHMDGILEKRSSRCREFWEE